MMRFKRFSTSEWFKQLRLQYRIETLEVYLNKHIYTWIPDFGTQTSLPTLLLQCALTRAMQLHSEDSERFAFD